MEIIYTKSKWEMPKASLQDFINRVARDGFGGTELHLDSLKEQPSEINQLHKDKDLFLIGQILTEGKNIAEHKDSFKRQVEFGLEAGSSFINVHAGKDFFSFEDNLELIFFILDYSRKSGIDFLIETHRGRLTYSLVETVKYIKAIPELKLTADFSHWMVVHESDLSGQSENLDLAVSRSYHIHARVGYEEGPQVTDPSAPEWKNHLTRHLNLWQKIIEQRKDERIEKLTITPEFGPPNYMHTLPFSNKPVSDVWEMNLKMVNILEQNLKL